MRVWLLTLLLLYVGIANSLHLLIYHQAHAHEIHFEKIISEETPRCPIYDFTFHQFIAQPFLETYCYTEPFVEFFRWILYEKSIIKNVLYVYVRGPPDLLHT